MTEKSHCPCFLPLLLHRKGGSCCPSTPSVHRSGDSPCSHITILGISMVLNGPAQLGLRVPGDHFGGSPTEAVWTCAEGMASLAWIQRGHHVLQGTGRWMKGIQGKEHSLVNPQPPAQRPVIHCDPYAAQRQVRPPSWPDDLPAAAGHSLLAGDI